MRRANPRAGGGRAVPAIILALLLALAVAACGPSDAPPSLQQAAAATNTALAAAAPAPPTPTRAPLRTATPGCCLRPAVVAATPAATAPGGPLPLEVREALYSPETGYALLLVHNPNPAVGLHRSPYRAALRGDDGRLLGVSEQGLPGSLDQTIFALPPGGTIVLTPRFVPAPLAPAAIEPYWPPAEQFQPWPAPGPLAEVAVEGVAPGRLALASGQVRNLTGADANLIVSVALFDEAGRLVNGAQDVVERVPAGGAAPFRIPLHNGVVAGRVEASAWPARLPGLRDWSAAAARPAAAR